MRQWRILTALSPAILAAAMGANVARAAPGIETDWLTKPAERAVLSNQFAKAAVLYQGAVALLGNEPTLMWRLAQIYTMGGKFNMAIESYRSFLIISKDPAKNTRAKAEIERLSNAPAPFVTEDVAGQVRQRAFALTAVKRARALNRKRKYRDAIRHYEAAMVMDNTLVGVFRLMGALYGKLRDKKLERAFYIRYLRLRPGGRLAVQVRKRLKGTKEVALVSFEASFPSAVYINYLALSARGKTPFKDVVLPSGTYTIILYHGKYHAARKLRISVKEGEKRTVKFDFGVIDVRLTPWARVRANDRDLGLWNEIGMPVGPYKLTFASDDGKKKMTRNIQLKPGQRLKITQWR